MAYAHTMHKVPVPRWIVDLIGGEEHERRQPHEVWYLCCHLFEPLEGDSVTVAFLLSGSGGRPICTLRHTQHQPHPRSTYCPWTRKLLTIDVLGQVSGEYDRMKSTGDEFKCDTETQHCPCQLKVCLSHSPPAPRITQSTSRSRDMACRDDLTARCARRICDRGEVV